MTEKNWLSCCFLLLLAGCGSSDLPEMGEVSGVVKNGGVR